MDRVMYCIAIIPVLIAAIIQPGLTIKCYECNSHNDSRCALETPPETMKKDCSLHTEGSKYKICRKIVQTIEYEVNGLQPDSRVIRSCGWDTSSYVNSCYQRSGFGGRQEVCTCSTEYCNTASASKTILILLASLLAIPVLL
ncbi:UPAR/Ly6 domain-containing protein crok-like [Rhodnius prolixus]